MTAPAHWLKTEQTVRDRLSEIVACESPSPDLGQRKVVKHLEACFMLDIIDDLRSDLKKARNEIEILRLYGNKDCTAMADERLASGEPLA